MKKNLKNNLDAVHELHMNGSLSRRDFIKYLSMAGAAAGLVGGPFGMLAKRAWAAKSIRFDGWGGVVSEAFRKYAFEPFTKATGIQVVEGSPRGRCPDLSDRNQRSAHVRWSLGSRL